MIRIVSLLFLAISAIFVVAPASAFDLFKKSTTDPQQRVPTCDDPNVHRKITHRFARADREYYRAIETIESFDHVTEVALVSRRPSPLVRRYCRARVTMSDKHRRTMYFMIEEDTSFVSWTAGVEFCIRGLDRWRVYDRDCRTVRP